MSAKELMISICCWATLAAMAAIPMYTFYLYMKL